MLNKTVITVVQKISDYSGKFISILIFPLIIVVVYTVIMRYVFHMPPNWGFEVSLFLYGIFIMMGDSYCLKLKAHVTVDVVPKMLKPKEQGLVLWAHSY